MAKNNSNNNISTLRPRSVDAPTPPPIKRAAAPVPPARNPYLEGATREEDLSAEQTVPLSKRKKQAVCEQEFPAPLPAEPVAGKPAASSLRAASPLAPAAPMRRHQITPEELTRAAWRYTLEEELPAPSPKPKKKKKD